MREGSACPPEILGPKILVSACLLGVPCNHRGQANASAAVQALATKHRLIPICPETAGGLPTPRPEAQLRDDGRVVNEAGRDVTDAFARGARAAVTLARAAGVTEAILKARSPSCGRGGVTTAALAAAGFAVCSEEDVTLE